MSSGPIQIDVALNASGVARGATDARKALTDLGDAVEDLDRSGGRSMALDDKLDDTRRAADKADNAIDDLGDTARRTGRDTERAADKMEQSMRDAQRASERLDNSIDDVGEHGGRSFKRVADGAQEVQQEIGQNLGEAVSSFRGDLSDLGQVGQDTLGGLAASIAGAGPAGLVGAFALAASAAGLGLITAGLEDAEQKQERLKESAAEWAQAYIEAGSTILTTTQIAAAGQDIFGDPERYKEARDNARAWGVEVSTAVAAMAGSQTAIDTVTGAVERQAAALEANARGADGYAQNVEQATSGSSAANDAYIKGKKALDDLTSSMQMGRETAGFMSEMLLDLVASASSATAQIDEVGNAVITLPDGTQVVVDAITGQASQNVDQIKGQLTDLPGDIPITVDADTGEATVDLDNLQAKADQTAAKRPIVRADADTAPAVGKLNALDTRQPAPQTVKVGVDSTAYDRWQPPVKIARILTQVFETVSKPFE